MIIRGLENMTSGDMMQKWALFGLNRGQQRGGRIAVYNYLMGRYREDGPDSF